MKAQSGENLLRINIDQRKSLLAFLKNWFNLDFSDYSVDSLHRRLEKVLNDHSFDHVDELIDNLKDVPDARDKFLDSFTVNVTDFFRDPNSFKCIQKKLFPILQEQKYIRIWIAGCSTGEEVLSLSILLHEQGLLERTKILATDISGKALMKARRSQFSIRYSPKHEEQYIEAGGTSSFKEYLEVSHKGINLAHALLRDVEWRTHDLIKDPYPGNFHLIFCRNVFIYFKPGLQNKVLHSLGNHLTPDGFLVQGSKESITLYNENQRFRELVPGCSVYQKSSGHSSFRW